MISVVIPVLNRSSQLVAAVESVRRQEVPDWEVVIVDDGSTDGSLEIAEQLHEADPRIRPLFHPHRINLGPGASRNLGVEAARGDLVVFLDSDDLLEPGALACFRTAFAENPTTAVVYGRAGLSGIRGDGTTFGDGLPGVRADLFSQLVRTNVVQTGAVAVRRDVFGAHPFPPEMPNSQDWACWLRLSENHPFLFVDTIFVTLRTQRESITGHGLSDVRAHCRYSMIQADFLRHLAGSLSGDRKLEAQRGLCWRSAECFLRSVFSLREGKAAASFRWFATSMRIAREPRFVARSLREAASTWARFRAGTAQPSYIREAEKCTVEEGEPS
jgi:glycosyltransferase involved in cell wall biosynthesis